jgi:hypothetical protein
LASEHVLGEVAREPSALADGAADVLLVHPAVHRPDGQEVAELARSDRRPRLRVEVLLRKEVEELRALRDHLAELIEHLLWRPAAAIVDVDLVRGAAGVLHPRLFPGLVLGGRTSEQHRLRPDHVREVVLHRPARTLRRAVPLLVVEGRAEVVEGPERSLL